MKLRITNDEWTVFRSFMDELQGLTEYETVRVMFFHLLTENFFRFTMKNKALALDFGTNDSEVDESIDASRESKFWSDLRGEIYAMEKSDLVELKQLNELREEAGKPFDKMFPERGDFSEVLEDFETLKAATNSKSSEATSKVTRRGMSQACRDFLKAAGAGSLVRTIEIEEIEWDSDVAESFETPNTNQPAKSKRSKRQAATSKKRKQNELSSSSSDDSDEDSKKIIKSGQSHVKQIIGLEKFPEKLKKYYENVE